MTSLIAPVRSAVLSTPAAPVVEALPHFRARLAFETDPADVYADLSAGVQGFVVIDARTPEFYARGHVPGAINIPHRTISAETTAHLSKDMLLVTYCDGPGCNASLKAAVKFSELGFRVKEMTGGWDWWVRVDGLPVATGDAPTSVATPVACGC